MINFKSPPQLFVPHVEVGSTKALAYGFEFPTDSFLKMAMKVSMYAIRRHLLGGQSNYMNRNESQSLFARVISIWSMGKMPMVQIPSIAVKDPNFWSFLN